MDIFESLDVTEECFESVSAMVEEYINELSIDDVKEFNRRAKKARWEDEEVNRINHTMEQAQAKNPSERKSREEKNAEENLSNVNNKYESARKEWSKDESTKENALRKYREARSEWYKLRKKNNNYKKYIDTQSRVEPETKSATKAIINRSAWTNANQKYKDSNTKLSNIGQEVTKAKDKLSAAQYAPNGSRGAHVARFKEMLRNS